MSTIWPLTVRRFLGATAARSHEYWAPAAIATWVGLEKPLPVKCLHLLVTTFIRYKKPLPPSNTAAYEPQPSEQCVIRGIYQLGKAVIRYERTSHVRIPKGEVRLMVSDAGHMWL